MKIEIIVKQRKDGKRKPLADFRPKHVDMGKYEHIIILSRFKTECNELVKGAVGIGISPRDDLLNNNIHQSINHYISKIFNRRNFLYTIVGEWSPENHRWHYHGFFKVRSKEDDHVDNYDHSWAMKQIDSLKRSISRQIGRCVTETIRNEPEYVNYMLKCYEQPIVLNSIQPWQLDSYITNQMKKVYTDNP